MLWGSSVENPPRHPGISGPPDGPTKERKENRKQGERNGVGGWGAEYESEAEERVRWLFIGISEVGAVEVWSYS